MKKNLARLICFVFLLNLIVGCGATKNTNTVYMIFDGLHQFGITDAVWPDGKPVTVEELEDNFKR